MNLIQCFPSMCAYITLILTTTSSTIIARVLVTSNLRALLEQWQTTCIRRHQCNTNPFRIDSNSGHDRNNKWSNHIERWRRVSERKKSYIEESLFGWITRNRLPWRGDRHKYSNRRGGSNMQMFKPWCCLSSREIVIEAERHPYNSTHNKTQPNIETNEWRQISSNSQWT